MSRGGRTNIGVVDRRRGCAGGGSVWVEKMAVAQKEGMWSACSG